MKFNKEINKLKIALTSDCVLRCSHCFVNKDSGETITTERAKKVLDLFIGSPGKGKILEIYGGEPLLRFGLAAKIISGALVLAGKKKKKLAVSLASNGLLIDEKKLSWMAGRGIRFSISFSGSEKSQNFTRRFPTGEGSYEAVRRKIPAILSIMGRNTHVICCVHPRRAQALDEDFKELVKLGFRNIGIECVHGFDWRENDYVFFARNLDKIIRFTLEQARRGDYILLEPFFEFFREREYKNLFCPFLRDLEIYPDGAFSFYPYAFVKNLAERERVSVGTAEKGIKKKFSNCLPEANSRRCADCVKNYYVLDRLKTGSLAYKARTEIFAAAARKIVLASKKDENIRGYLKYLVREYRKGYT